MPEFVQTIRNSSQQREIRVRRSRKSRFPAKPACQAQKTPKPFIQKEINLARSYGQPCIIELDETKAASSKTFPEEAFRINILAVTHLEPIS
jgi:hypothetical protein